MRYAILMLLMACALGSFGQDASKGELTVAEELAGLRTDDASLQLYPNPTSGRFFVHWGKRSLLRMPVEVRTLDGRLMRMDAISTNDELDASTLPDGTYALYLMDLSGVRAYRLFRVAH